MGVILIRSPFSICMNIRYRICRRQVLQWVLSLGSRIFFHLFPYVINIWGGKKGRYISHRRAGRYVSVRVCIRNQCAGGRIRVPCIYTDTPYVCVRMWEIRISKKYICFLDTLPITPTFIVTDQIYYKDTKSFWHKQIYGILF